MFGGSAHVTLNVFIFRHLVIHWERGAWHIVGGGNPSGGHRACVRRGKGNKGRSGGWSRCPNKGLIIVNVGEGDWRRSLGGGSIHV
jgi:hypothetical protein